MLQLYMLPSDSKAAEIVQKFINDRLIGLMEGIILDEVSFDMAAQGVLSEEIWNRPLEEIVDLNELAEDMDFAENVSSLYLPQDFPIDKANYEFFSLYRLLKARGEYKPPLPMEYILYNIIYGEIEEVDATIEYGKEIALEETDEEIGEEAGREILDNDNDLNEEITTVKRIPEPDRSRVLQSVRENCEPEDDPEELMLWYEDLREYEEVCFEDTDCLLLDEIEEDALYQSDMAKLMGINDRPDRKIVNMDLDGKPVRMDVRIAPWEEE